MALTPGRPAGAYYQFDNVCNDGALVVFKIRQFLPDREIPRPGGKVNVVSPVVVDLVVIDGSEKGRVIRGEELIGSGFKTFRRGYSEGNDIPCLMAWGDNKHGGPPYPQANPQPEGSEAYNRAVEVFKATNGDPYTAGERAAAPTATLASAPAAAPPAQTPPPAAPVEVPAQAPAADAGLGPAPWSAPAAAATNGAPVAAGPGPW